MRVNEREREPTSGVAPEPTRDPRRLRRGVTRNRELDSRAAWAEKDRRRGAARSRAGLRGNDEVGVHLVRRNSLE